MEDMDRRDFMAAALGGVTFLGASGFLGRNPAIAAVLSEAATQVYTRRNVYCLTAASPEIVAYKTAIQAMQALPDTNGVSWMAQANIHGTFTPPPGMITAACQHNTMFFLSWHRMYVYFFERIVRKMSGDPNFALPYWGYSPTGPHDLPQIFRTPTAGNPLYTANRKASINAGTPIIPALVDAGTALSQVPFFDFTNALNALPHGQVHTAVGGGMANFQQAAQDPIFWLHHCNIDRLWELWLGRGAGRVNPITDPIWRTTPFQFYDENGGTVMLTGEKIVDTACQLHYQYESDDCGKVIVFDPRWWERLSHIRLPSAAIAAKLDSLGARPPLPAPQSLTQAQQPIQLGAKPVQVALPVSDEGKRILATWSRGESGGHINLVLDDIQVQGTPRVAYEVYINLPTDVRNPEYTGPNFVGAVNLFGPSSRDMHAAKPESQIIPLSLVYLRLREAERWSDDTVRVTFMPRGLTEGEDPARTLRGATQVIIGRVSVQIQ